MEMLMLTRQRNRAPIHHMTPNVPRVMAAISFVIDEAHRRKRKITQYDIVKSLFLADRASLNKYGRPVTFDNYAAMKDGPVPTLAYNLLRGDETSVRRHGVRLPWRSKAAPELGARANAFLIDSKDVDVAVLSPSDIQELESALTIVQSLGFRQVRKLTHDDPAYIEAWDDEGGANRYPMSYSLLFDVPNDELANELAFLSKHV
jgi:uncharacterized phage-associated protein